MALDIRAAGKLPEQTRFMREQYAAMRVPIKYAGVIVDPLGYSIPYIGHEDYAAVRLMNPGERGKYLRPKGEFAIYFSPDFKARMATMPAIVILVEGEKKCQCAAYHWKLPAIGIPGKDCWHEKGTYALHPDLVEWIGHMPPGSKLVIVPDGDIHHRHDIKASYGSMIEAIRKLRFDVEVIVKALPEAEPRLGIDDWMVSTPRTKTLKELMALPDIKSLPRMKNDIITHAEYAYTESERGKTLLAVEHNISVYIAQHFDFRMDTTLGPVKFDDIGQWSRLKDSDIVVALKQAQLQLLTKFTMNHARYAVASIMAANECSVLADWVRSTRWDGEKRLDKFFLTYATPDPSISQAYLIGAARALFTGLVGRILDPGVKFDLMLVLVGEQGIGKSTLLQILAGGPDFYAEVMHVNTIDDLKRLGRGAAIIDIAELHSWNKLEIAQVKGWLSAQWDTYVDKFDKLATSRPKGYIAVGSTNEMGFLRDPSGERRYLPVHLLKIDLEAFRRDREQLLAEAAWLYMKSGVHFEVAGAKVEQVKHKVRYGWADQLEQAIDGALTARKLPAVNGEPMLTMHWVHERAIQEPNSQRWNKEIGAHLRTMGWDDGGGKMFNASGITWRGLGPSEFFKTTDGKVPRQVRYWTLKRRP